jgi:hypothetical protein
MGGSIFKMCREHYVGFSYSIISVIVGCTYQFR